MLLELLRKQRGVYISITRRHLQILYTRQAGTKPEEGCTKPSSQLFHLAMAVEMQQIIELILAIFLPPLAIFIHGSDCNIHVAVNIILCFFLYIPAVIHALWYCFFRG
ncbi:hypothetical protein NECAME_07866 [Necator americanus]|uniref:Proteolipid membrane potential modulator n=1 Tax=Necator americanus TaxID=51031 RepID=W2TLS1_NECAM|nr:hypothetical protein NECAME_07866 [Necator americanus]ETN82574.1 hypothetical protein NECAME_07866 [Necator americanus]